jgi:hypothetical protein
MLGVMRGDVETGVYGAAYKVYEGVGYLPGVVASVLTPRLSSLFMTDRKAHQRLMLTGLAGSISLALVVGVLGYQLAEPLLVLLFGANFAVAAAPFRILCLVWCSCSPSGPFRGGDFGQPGAVAAPRCVDAWSSTWPRTHYAVPHYGATGAARHRDRRVRQPRRSRDRPVVASWPLLARNFRKHEIRS